MLKYSTAWNLRASEILLFYRNKCKSSAPILWMEAQSLGGWEDGSAGERQDWWDSHAQFCLPPFTSTPPLPLYVLQANSRGQTVRAAPWD